MNRSAGLALVGVAAALTLFSCPGGSGPEPGPNPGDGGPDASVDAGPDASVDAGPDAGANSDAGTDAGPGIDAGTPDAGPDAGPYLTAFDQSLALTTELTVSSVKSSGSGWIVVSDVAADGGPGAVLGHIAVSGVQRGVVVPLDVGIRATDGEHFFALLLVDQAPVGTLDPGDVPVTSEDGGLVGAAFTATVAAGTPDLAFTLNPNFLSLSNAYWTWSNATPSAYANDFESGFNPSIHLRKTWRYRVTNPGTTFHPAELITQGRGATADTVLLAQSSAGITGTLQSDPTIHWTTSSNDFVFTASASLQAAMDGYRCGVHASLMRGDAGFF